MNEAEIVARARSVIGNECIYELGRGGFRGAADVPWDQSHRCDCTGFLAWCLGENRQTKDPWYRSVNGGWLESSAIFRDCSQPFGLFDGVPWKEARPGMVLVCGDRTDAAGKRHQGHVGVISEVDEEGPSLVVHCSSTNWKTKGDAIQETAPLIFKTRDALVARCGLIAPVAA